MEYVRSNADIPLVKLFSVLNFLKVLRILLLNQPSYLYIQPKRNWAIVC